jgi:uncharacterized protein (DUF1501 family)
MSQFNRRKFLKGMSASTLATAATVAPSISFAGSSNNYSDNILIFVFLRGGMDGLSLYTPMDGHPDRGNYESLRSNGTMIPSNQLLSVGQGFGLHPAAAPLQELYQQNDLAIVRACGLPDYEVNRSHFEAERYAELGTPGNRFTQTGWLTRHLQTATNYPASIPLPVVVTESKVTFSLLREPTAVTLRYPSNFDFDTTTSSNFKTDQEATLASIYAAGSGELDAAGEQAMAALNIVEQIDFTAPPDNGAQYPTYFDDPTYLTSFGSKMKTLAQLIKQETGIRIGQADRGGWDTHNQQNNLVVGDGFYDNVRDLSEGLKAFFTDLDVAAPGGGTWADRTNVLVYSEFGRRAFDNSDAGTDHGWANTSLVLGGGVNGGQYGQWPGLAPSDLFQGADLRGTVDYRSVWGEILLKRLHNNQFHQIFPGFPRDEYKPLGVVSGAAIEPDFNDDPGLVYKDSFE